MVTANIVLAAIPRSGSTLSCQLLNQFDNCLAMIEPLDMSAFRNLSGSPQRLTYLANFFEQTRQQIKTSGKIPVTQLGDESTNTFTAHGTQGRTSSISGIRWEKPKQAIGDDFTLVIKHPNAFSALIGELKDTFSCYALVRNPLAIIASWNTLDHPLRTGNAPMAEAFDTHLQELLTSIDVVLDRQLALLNWYFKKFRQELLTEQILRYEDIIASNGAALSAISDGKPALDIQLTNQNQNSLYDGSQVSKAATALLKDTDNACWHFYDQDEVAQLAKL